MAKREVGVRHIRGNKFLKAKTEHKSRKEAKKSQKVFQERSHLTRIIPRKRKGKKDGFNLWYSEKRLRK